MKKFNDLAVQIMKIIGCIILLFLFIFSFIFTQRHGKDGTGEYVCQAPLYQIADNLIINIAAIIVILLLAMLILNSVKKYQVFFKRLDQILCFATPLFIGGLSLYWVWNSGSPMHDQWNVYQAAISFNHTDFSYLAKGAYLNLYPQQLGLVGFYQMLFLLFKTENYQIIQYVNCIFAAGLVILIYLCMKEMGGKAADRVLFSIFSLTLLPLILYASFVYGEVPSIFFLFLFCYTALKFFNKISIKYAIGAAVSGSFMLIMRINTLIVLIAFLIIAAVFCINKKRWKIFVISVVIAACCLVPVKGIQVYYEKISGYEVDGGLPYILWIAMGISEEASKPGWFDNYPAATYLSQNMDAELSGKQALTKIKSRLNLLGKNPVEGVSFYKRKICTQWNDPTYNSYRNSLGGTYTLEEYTRTPFMNKLLNHMDKSLSFLSVLQLIIYGGALLYVLGRHTAENIPNDIFLVTIIGGFLFSIIWEADSRYILPYYICMIPCAFRGWISLAEGLTLQLKGAGKSNV